MGLPPIGTQQTMVHSADKTSKAASNPAHAPLRVLIVDGDPLTAKALQQALSDRTLDLVHSRSLKSARQFLTDRQADLVLLNPRLPDGDGLSLVPHMDQNPPRPSLIALCEDPSLTQAIELLRQGMDDLLIKPASPADLGQSVQRVLHRQAHQQRYPRHMGRLRDRCQQLRQAHHQIARQVDVLCQDLVVAYQELALQMHQVLNQNALGQSLTLELDLESILRKTLEHLLDQVGPTNAAIFLPSHADEYTLGGYVQYDHQADATRLELELLADLVASRIAGQSQAIHLSDPAVVADWLGLTNDPAPDPDSAAVPVTRLQGCDLLGFSCIHQHETLAVVVLYRDRQQPFQPEHIEQAAAVGPILAQALARSIRIHHRHR